ncbi:polysaccharide biosynthesis protein [Oxobacter pfennigii]|uniref:Polysaccharide biosynthesis protein n=1 Tax=Oxobacter pfennigii TaxID=36849 RepID=A0A0P8WZ29_9CLOT|nr:oligosaccharide flippase family protein [Oxobacter pfennigii]KPU43716.1 polysaccharide biosynthesis protein [Oxobacter pfennigii]
MKNINIKSVLNDITVKASLGYSIGNILIKGISFLTLPVFTRILSTSDFGIYNSYIAYETILYMIIGITLHDSIRSAKYEFKNSFNEYISSITLIVILNLCVSLLIVHIYSEQLSKFTGFEKIILNILLIHSACTAILLIYNYVITLSYSYKQYLIMAFLNTGLNIGLSLLLISQECIEKKYLGRIFGASISMIVISLWILLYFYKRAKPVFNYDYWKFAIKYSIPIVPHGLSQVILSQFDRVMIQRIVGASEAGLYSFSYTLSTIYKIIINSLESTWSPWFYEQMGKKNYDNIRKRSNVYFIIFLFIIMILVFITPEITIIMSGRDFWNSKYTTIPVLLGSFFAAIYVIPVQVEYYYKKTSLIAMGTIGAAIINIILNVICINKYGYIAAAYTTLLSYFINFIFHLIMTYKIIGFMLFDLRMIALIVICLFFIGIISLFAMEKFIVRFLFLIIWSVILSMMLYKIINKDYLKGDE